MEKTALNKEQIHVIGAVTFGNILEWFEVYSFAYLAPILAQKFFSPQSGVSSLMLAFLVFGLGFITRPIGGIIFGRIGDRIGRKKAFVLSIIVLTVPTFMMGFLPTYETWGIAAPISLCLLRLIQSIPTGGEIPGVICYLYENANENNKRYMTSWNAVGNQIGAIIGLFETFLMENYMSDAFLSSWGWRISFISGGVIGLAGIYLRHTLHETPVFLKLKQSHKVDRETVRQLLANFKAKIGIGTAYGLVDAATFYLIATYVPTFINDSLGLSVNQNMFISFVILLITTVLLPYIGRLADRYSNRWMCIGSALLVIALLYPLSVAMSNKDIVSLSIIGFLFLLPISCITALIAYLLGSLFPPQVRFTGVGVAVNLADGIVGGFTPAIALLLLQFTGDQSAFCWYIFICALISLIAYATTLRD
ncbi:MAG: MFS transporter [Verrucomicrobia bacterium]|nr:MFS transporter [Verrucomicrobiota bacterium]